MRAGGAGQGGVGSVARAVRGRWAAGASSKSETNLFLLVCLLSRKGRMMIMFLFPLGGLGVVIVVRMPSDFVCSLMLERILHQS